MPAFSQLPLPCKENIHLFGKGKMERMRYAPGQLAIITLPNKSDPADPLRFLVDQADPARKRLVGKISSESYGGSDWTPLLLHSKRRVWWHEFTPLADEPRICIVKPLMPKDIQRVSDKYNSLPNRLFDLPVAADFKSALLKDPFPCFESRSGLPKGI